MPSTTVGVIGGGRRVGDGVRLHRERVDGDVLMILLRGH